MKKYNQEMLAEIFKLCEKYKDTTKVGPEYYKWFLSIRSQGMERLVALIIADRADSINKKLSAGEFESDDKFFEYITDFLELIAMGVMGFRETDAALVLSKPVGPGPTREMEDKIDEKIKGTIPLIEKVLLKSTKKKSMPRECGTNDLKKGTRVLLSSGLTGELVDNMRGNRRRVRVFEPIKDEGVTWAHRIIEYCDEKGVWHPVVHTKKQLKIKEIHG